MIVSQPSRSQLLTWIGQLTNNTVQKIQHLSDGLLFCEVFDKIYPKYISLHKLKKDPKTPLEKEKNFRILLNAINQLGLCVRINIVDLSHGKITSLLELLQWFYKEYKNPMAKACENDEKGIPFHEPRMIKSYVGNLFLRQQSCQKENNPDSGHLRSSRRSLDSKMSRSNIFQSDENKTVKSKSIKSIQKSQNKETSKSKVNSSKIKSITFNEQAFKQSSSKKRESMKKQLEQKGSQKKSEIQQKSIHSILKNALNFERPKLQETLIKITEATLESNPELKQRIQMILQNPRQRQTSIQNSNQAPDNQVKNILASHLRTSDNFDNDTLQLNIELESNYQESPRFNKLEIEPNQTNITVYPDENSVPIIHQNSEKKEAEPNKKDTVKKSLLKSAKEKTNNILLMSQKSSRLISANKSSVQRENNIFASNHDQNRPQNQLIFTRLHVSPLFDGTNPENYVTEKKIETNPELRNDENPREVQSEKQQTNVDDSIWKSNFFGQYPKLP